MSGRRFGAAAIALGLIVTAAGSAGGQRADLGDKLKAAGSGTEAGAAEIVALLHPGLLAPPDGVDGAARELCGRFLPKAAARIDQAGAKRLAERLDAWEALAMCRWLAGDDTGAAAAIGELVRVCRGDDCSAALERAVRLAERWLWAGPALKVVEGQLSALSQGALRADHGTLMTRLSILRDRLRAAADQAAQVRHAGGGEPPARGLLVVAVSSGSAAAQAGVRAGDVLLSVKAYPVWSDAGLARAVARMDQGDVVWMRAGRKGAGLWRGEGASGLRVVPVPERLPAR